ncbi:MAG: hypothetical protein AB7V00_04900 [Bacilli bacterium]
MFLYIKNNWLLLTIMAIMVGISLIFILLNGQEIIMIFSYIAASYLFLVGISFFVSAVKFSSYLENSRRQKHQQLLLILEACLLIVLGVVILVFSTYSVRAIVGILLIILPTIQMFMKTSKWAYFRKNFWKYLVGLVFILATEAIIDYVFFALGLLILGLVCYFIYLFIINYHDLSRPNLIIKYGLLYLNKKGRR